MIQLKKIRHGIPFITVWYAKEKLKDAGIIQYRQASFQANQEDERFDTLVTNLLEDEEAIISHISKNGRYEIRRASKENIGVVHKLGKSITEEDIINFCDFFVEFWESKGVTYTDRDKLAEEIREYVKADAFAFSIAVIQGKPCIYHTYIVGKNTVRLYHSASLYRVLDEIPTSIIGMANRYLHKEDMIYFKNLRKEFYDWGGAGTDAEVASITKFKESFGGEKAVYYNFEDAKGIRAKLFKWLISMR